MRAVVTGGAGFIGSWLCEQLLQDGAAVVCLDNGVTGSRENVLQLAGSPGFEYVESDVCAPLEVEGPIDMVFHLASIASPVHYTRLPLETLRAGSVGTTNVLELAEAKGARFLLASTSEVYGDPREHPQRETYWGNVNPVGPRSVYDESKRYSEATTAAYRRARGVDTTIARIFNTYGPRMSTDDGRVVPTFVLQALAGEAITVAGDGSQTRSLCWVEDTVDGLLRLASSDEPGPVNIGARDEMTILELARVVRELTGSRSEITHVPLPPDDPERRCPDTAAAERLLGWRASTPVEDGLKSTIAWMAQAPTHTGRCGA